MVNGRSGAMGSGGNGAPGGAGSAPGDIGAPPDDTASPPGGPVDWHARLHAAMQAIADNPADRRAELDRAHATLGLGHYGPALALLDHYLRRVPDDPRAWDLRAAALLYLGRLDAAEASGTRALEADPDYRVAHYNRACARIRLGDAAGAMADLAAACAADPDLRGIARHDPDFAPLRQRPDFKRLVAGDDGAGSR